MTWQEFFNAVVARLSDAAPSESVFTEAVSEYLRARIARDLLGDKDRYAIHQNRYSALRRKLVGFATTQDDAALRAAVRAQCSEIVPDDAQFALACSYWVQGHGVGAVNRNLEEAGSWMSLYRQKRVQLLGFTPSFANAAALKTAVEKYLVTTALSDNLSNFLDAQLEAASSDLKGLANWVNQQIAAARADLQSLGERVDKEIRSAVIGLQELIQVYRVGQTSTFADGDDGVTTEGLATSSILPEQAVIREAWMVYPDQDDPEAGTECRRIECVRVPWQDRHKLICCELAHPAISIDPYARGFLISPALVEGESELELIWDGVKFEFEDADETPLDEGAAEAVALRVQAALAPEFGDATAVAREYARQADERVRLLYAETLGRKRAGARNA